MKLTEKFDKKWVENIFSFERSLSGKRGVKSYEEFHWEIRFLLYN